MATTRRRGRNNAIQTKTTTSFSREEEEEENFGFTKMKTTTKKSKSKSKGQRQKQRRKQKQPQNTRFKRKNLYSSIATSVSRNSTNRFFSVRTPCRARRGDIGNGFARIARRV